MMKIKDLNKAVKILESTKEIDLVILKIEKYAELVVNGNAKSSFDLKIQNLISSKETDSNKIDLRDSEFVCGEIIRNIKKNMFGYAPGGFVSSGKTEKNSDDVLSVDLTENETLQFLGLILGVKQRQRKVFMDQLESFGISY